MYIQVDVTLIGHPKLKRLARNLGVTQVTALGHLATLWAWVARYAPDGDLTDYLSEPDIIADAGGWEGDPQQFVDALLGARVGDSVGFLEIAVDGALLLHDWQDYFGSFAERRRYRLTRTPLIERCDSPVETLLYEAFQTTMGNDDLPVHQFQVGKYRLDFAWPARHLAVEVDGHDFHKSKRQRSHDAQRDRDLLKLGWTTLRFTGSDVFHDANGVAEEVSAFIYSVSEES